MTAEKRSMVEKIRARIVRRGRGSIFIPDDFFDLGPDATVIWALWELRKMGVIRQLSRGLYDYPKYSRLLNKQVAPDMNRVAQALARKFHWRISPTREAALNLLGLSTQVPMRHVYMSDGPSRTYTILGTELSFRHQNTRASSLYSSPASLLVSVLSDPDFTKSPQLQRDALEIIQTEQNIDAVRKGALQTTARARKNLRMLLHFHNHGYHSPAQEIRLARFVSANRAGEASPRICH